MRFLLTILLATAAAWVPAAAAVPAAKQPVKVGIEEHLGRQIPADLTFRDEGGQPVKLISLVKKPTILALVYFECPGICTPVLTSMAEVFGQVGLKPDRDYNVVTVSFNPEDTPSLAREKKANYMNLVKGGFPSQSWRFLTGDKKNIDRLCDTVGFRYQKDGDQFLHAASLFVLSPKGKITRYLYGTDYLPFDVKMALVEAGEGRTGPTINKMLRYCFAYDPAGRRYVLRATQIGATAILLAVVGFLVYVGASGKKRRESSGTEADSGS